MRIILNSFSKILITIILTLLVLILIKSNQNFKMYFYNNIYEKSISFAKINSLYQTKFGSILPLKNVENTKKVFNEEIIYEEYEKYFDGVLLHVNDNYLVPAKKSGVVVYIGEKENYGKVIIVNGDDGVDIWYGNLENVNVSLYDYIEDGTYIGSVNKDLYLVFKKDGKYLDYEKYI